MGLVHTTRTITFVSMNGITYSMTAIEASDLTHGGAHFQKWHMCFGCSLDFPEGKTVLVNGRRYGVPCGCYKDGE